MNVQGIVAAVAAGSLALGLTACGSSQSTAPQKPKTVTVTKKINAPIDGAELILTGLDAPEGDKFEAGVTPCLADNSLVATADRVVLRDASGETIAFADLGSGTLGQGSEPISSPCEFPVVFEDVPLGEKFYEIQVGDNPPVTLPEDELTNEVARINIE